MGFKSSAFLLAALLLLSACPGGGISGKYANDQGNASIEFLADGKAHISAGGMGLDCTYVESGKKITVTCDGESSDFTMGGDGALTGPPEGYLTRLTKSR